MIIPSNSDNLVDKFLTLVVRKWLLVVVVTLRKMDTFTNTNYVYAIETKNKHKFPVTLDLTYFTHSKAKYYTDSLNDFSKKSLKTHSSYIFTLPEKKDAAVLELMPQPAETWPGDKPQRQLGHNSRPWTGNQIQNTLRVLIGWQIQRQKSHFPFAFFFP